MVVGSDGSSLLAIQIVDVSSWSTDGEWLFWKEMTTELLLYVLRACDT